MKVNYSDEKVLKGEKSIFLAGPTPRSKKIGSWRPEAIKILENLNFTGIVYCPERNFDDRTFDYTNQVEWERQAQEVADVILFWVPRELKNMPAFTTNVEFGYWIGKNKGKVIYGRPANSEKNRYLDKIYFLETGKEPFSELEELLKRTVESLM